MADEKKSIFQLADKFGFASPFKYDWVNEDFKNPVDVPSISFKGKAPEKIEINKKTLIEFIISGKPRTLQNNIDVELISTDGNISFSTFKLSGIDNGFTLETYVIAKTVGSHTLQFKIDGKNSKSISLSFYDNNQSKEYSKATTEKTTGDWYVNHKTGEYVWFDKKEKRSGYTGVGHYKVIFDRVNNVLKIYTSKEETLIKSLDMNKDDSNQYKSDQAAKFALIAAELGGSYVNNDDPTVQPLIIGATIDNRLKLLDLGIKAFSSDGTSNIQKLKGYQAMTKKSYTDFKYGNEKRFGLGESALQKKNMNIGLSTVFTATLYTVDILNKYYSVPKGKTKQFEQILYYAHGSGNTINGTFDVAIPEGTNDSFQYIRGDNKYKEMLSPEEKEEK